MLFGRVGYEFNGDRPSVPWGIAGCVVGTVLAVALRRRTGIPATPLNSRSE